MRPAARLAAAMEILDAWLAHAGPADRLIAAWGRTHRFAGRKDRAAIADSVYAGLRRRSSAAALMGVETGRALVLGALALDDALSAEAIRDALAEGGPYGPPPLGPAEQAALAAGLARDTAAPIRRNYPVWLHERLVEALGAGLDAEMAALSDRAPLDLRVNSLKTTRDAARAALREEGLEAALCRHAPLGLRLPPGSPVARSRAYAEGLVEIQDEGSQIASLMADARPGMTVIDLAAGAGGKSLALAAAMENSGRIIAADIDPERLGKLAPRAARAGAAIIESRALHPWSAGADPDFADLAGGADLVVLDAPCSGSGTWRRTPEAKWRLTPEGLDALTGIQARLLDRAAGLVRPGGRLAYMTCSLLETENSGAIHAFLGRGAKFAVICPDEVLNRPGSGAISGLRTDAGAVLSPVRSGTDGFFVSLLRRTG